MRLSDPPPRAEPEAPDQPVPGAIQREAASTVPTGDWGPPAGARRRREPTTGARSASPVSPALAAHRPAGTPPPPPGAPPPHARSAVRRQLAELAAGLALLGGMAGAWWPRSAGPGQQAWAARAAPAVSAVMADVEALSAAAPGAGGWPPARVAALGRDLTWLDLVAAPPDGHVSQAWQATLARVRSAYRAVSAGPPDPGAAAELAAAGEDLAALATELSTGPGLGRQPH